MASVSQTCLRASAESSRNGLAPASTASDGTNIQTRTAVRNARPATIANAHRQPTNWPTALARGTPMIVATVSPSSTRPTALVRLSAGTREAATSIAVPKYAPCGSPERNRSTSIEW
jgi:hypothetical protein